MSQFTSPTFGKQSHRPYGGGNRTSNYENSARNAQKPSRQQSGTLPRPVYTPSAKSMSAPPIELTLMKGPGKHKARDGLSKEIHTGMQLMSDSAQLSNSKSMLILKRMNRAVAQDYTKLAGAMRNTSSVSELDKASCRFAFRQYLSQTHKINIDEYIQEMKQLTSEDKIFLTLYGHTPTENYCPLGAEILAILHAAAQFDLSPEVLKKAGGKDQILESIEQAALMVNHRITEPTSTDELAKLVHIFSEMIGQHSHASQENHQGDVHEDGKRINGLTIGECADIQEIQDTLTKSSPTRKMIAFLTKKRSIGNVTRSLLELPHASDVPGRTSVAIRNMNAERNRKARDTQVEIANLRRELIEENKKIEIQIAEYPVKVQEALEQSGKTQEKVAAIRQANQELFEIMSTQVIPFIESHADPVWSRLGKYLKENQGRYVIGEQIKNSTAGLANPGSLQEQLQDHLEGTGAADSVVQIMHSFHQPREISPSASISSVIEATKGIAAEPGNAAAQAAIMTEATSMDQDTCPERVRDDMTKLKHHLDDILDAEIYSGTETINLAHTSLDLVGDPIKSRDQVTMMLENFNATRTKIKKAACDAMLADLISLTHSDDSWILHELTLVGRIYDPSFKRLGSMAIRSGFTTMQQPLGHSSEVYPDLSTDNTDPIAMQALSKAFGSMPMLCRVKHNALATAHILDPTNIRLPTTWRPAITAFPISWPDKDEAATTSGSASEGGDQAEEKKGSGVN